MKLHANAGLSLKGHRLLVDRVLVDRRLVAEAAGAAGVSERTACKWLARFGGEGEQGLLDRSCAPTGTPSRTPEGRVQVIAAFSTVSGILTKIGMGKLGRKAGACCPL